MKYYNVYFEDIDKKFTYFFHDEIEIGKWVKVKFKNREKCGIILEKVNELKIDDNILPILKIIDNIPLIPQNLLELYKWVAKYYISSLKEVITFAYPKNLKSSYSNRIYIAKQSIPLNNIENEIFEYLNKKKEVSEVTLKRKFDKNIIEKLIENGILAIKKVLVESNYKFLNEIKNSKSISLPTVKLTFEQEKAKETILKTNKRNILLFGVTGSGKTEIYIEIMREGLLKGEGSIFLVPEISLTPQMMDRVSKVFGENVAVLHSRMTDLERKNEWKAVYEGKKKIVLGVRSAIFAPVNNLKYIIIDEEHENTYKQDVSPRYNAKYVAIKRGEIENAKVIFGSATPSIESFYYAKKGVFEFIKLTSRFSNYEKPDIKVINMQKEENNYLSNELLEAIYERLKKKEQILLFLNRKGFSNYVQCKACGHIEKCSHCSVSYIYYKSKNILKCSYCGKAKNFLNRCSKCGSKDINYSGVGTEKIENELKYYFKEAKILRVDSETVQEREAYEKIYREFLNQKYDILLGTQIISKGIHFPNITLSGIIAADSILNFPDFRAAEKTFQMIVQASGRAGRGDKKGEVIIQTYVPDSYVIRYALMNDYEKFYEEEIRYREELRYPPFGRIINIIISSEEEKILEEKAYNFLKKIKVEGKYIEIFGPFQAPIYKIKNRYRYQIFIKGDRESINNLKENLNNIIKEENKNYRISIDVDPINLM